MNGKAYACVYKITNLVNGKVYIGQSVCIEERWKNEKKGQVNGHLRNAFNKYGMDNFRFEILRNVPLNTGITITLLNAYEMYFIRQYQSSNQKHGYNKTDGGTTNYSLSDETRKLLSEKRTGKGNAQYGKKGILSPKYGKKHSLLVRQKQSMALKGKKKTPEHCANMSKCRIGKKLNISPKRLEQLQNQCRVKTSGNSPTAKKVLCLELNETFPCITDAEKRMKGIESRSSIKASLRSGRTYRGFTWVYVKNDEKYCTLGAVKE
jgi:group I intron endonuclease